MSDITERLRSHGVIPESLGMEAADEIERLRERLADYEEAHKLTVEGCGASDERHCSCVPSLRLEIERLQGLLRDAKNTLDGIVCIAIEVLKEKPYE